MLTFRHRAALIGARILLSAASSLFQSGPALSARPQPSAAVADVGMHGTSIHDVCGGLFAQTKIGSPIPSLKVDLMINIRQ
jgi:hypothetical protein